MTGLLVALGAALAPALPTRMISTRELSRIRDQWLLGTLALGTVWLAWYEPWLAIMGAWHLFKWRSPAALPGLVTWGAIGATWFLLRSMPGWAWDWIPWAWLLIAAGHVGFCVYFNVTTTSPYQRKPLFGWWRTKATQGSPAITALYFALMAPFCPWWGWPILAVGLYLTWSWLAFIGVGVGMAMMYPAWAGWIVGAVALVLWTWMLSWLGKIKLFEWTPRGDSFDSVVNRLIVWILIVQAWWHGPRLLGRGPYSLEPELRRWSSRCWIELPNGEACNDWLQHGYEYGLLGMAALALVGWRLAPHLALGDPWSAAVVAFATMALGHYPGRQPAIGLVGLTCMAAVVR